MPRCFIGVLIPEEDRNSIINMQNEILKLPIKGKFVEPENLHISFSFLGEVDESKIESINEGLDGLAKNYASFRVNLLGVKAIPNLKFIQVIALNVIDDKGILEKLRKEIQEKVGGDSKPPHVTICRVKAIESKHHVVEKLEEMKDLPVAHLMVSSVQLIKSELNRDGPSYSIIHESRFGQVQMGSLL